MTASSYAVPDRPIKRLVYRIAKRLAGQYWPEPPEEKKTSTGGTAKPESGAAWEPVELSTRRTDVYEDMEEIDQVMPEGSRALDILADNAVNSPEGAQRSFTIRFDEGPKVSQAKQTIIKELIDRTRLQEKAYGIARETLKYGDNFQQIIISQGFHVVRLMYMPPESMRRNEDNTGLLKRSNKRGEWAFEQYEPGTTRFLAGFYPWQIEHIRWNRGGKSKYGRPALFSGRYPFKKLMAMEEALVINWLTRAFARLCFILDTTGKSQQEAQVYLKQFMDAISKRNIAAGIEGIERLSVAKDIAIGRSRENLGGQYLESLNDVKILDTSNTGFWNMSAVEYWRNKFISATGVPKAHLGLEQDINAKATLQWQDERFARLVRRVQMTMSEFISHIISMELILQGIDPRNLEYVIEWPSPSTLDQLDLSQTMLRFAQASQIFVKQGIVSAPYVAQRWLKMRPGQWKQVQQEIAENPPKEPEDNGDGEE